VLRFGSDEIEPESSVVCFIDFICDVATATRDLYPSILSTNAQNGLISDTAAATHP
jgi:hypothetical protein